MEVKHMSDSVMNNKIDFMAIVTVENANPNGDPAGGNRPRQHYDGTGFITPVCIKRKLRNRLQDMGRNILIQQNNRPGTEFSSIVERLNSVPEIKEARKNKAKDKKSKDSGNNTALVEKICQYYEDVRAFGATIVLQKKSENESGDSVGIRGPVTIQTVPSIDSVDVEDVQITKSTNSTPEDKKGSDTMGHMYCVRYGIYVIKGSINPLLAKGTGFSEEDMNDIKEALRTLFVNDESAARPSGSMNVYKLYWWKQDAQNIRYSSKKLFDTVKIKKKNPDEVINSTDDIEITVEKLPDGDITPEIIEGF